MPNLATNKQVKHSYELLDKFEAGIVLTGAEVKACKQKNLSLKGAYVSYEKDNLWLKKTYIAPYQEKNQPDYDPEHPRKLLLQRAEIDSLMGKSKSHSLTIVPINVYTKGGLIKVQIALARGRKKHDKRELIKKRDLDRKVQRALRGKQGDV